MANTWDTSKTTIDKTSPVPLYYQLINMIYEKVKSGELKPGDALPTEQEFRQMYGLSQTTIRKAISELIHEEVVEAHRPKGVFVCQPKIEEYSNGFLTSFTEEFQQSGYVPRSKIMRFDTIPCYGHTAEELHIAPGGMTHYIYRIRYLNDEPMSINYDYISADLVPELKRENFAQEGKEQSLYYILRDVYGIKLVRAVETVTAVLLSKEEAVLLNTTAGAPVINRKRLAFDENDRPILSEKTLIRYAYKTVLVDKKG